MLHAVQGIVAGVRDLRTRVSYNPRRRVSALDLPLLRCSSGADTLERFTANLARRKLQRAVLTIARGDADPAPANASKEIEGISDFQVSPSAERLRWAPAFMSSAGHH